MNYSHCHLLLVYFISSVTRILKLLNGLTLEAVTFPLPFQTETTLVYTHNSAISTDWEVFLYFITFKEVDLLVKKYKSRNFIYYHQGEEENYKYLLIGHYILCDINLLYCHFYLFTRFS